MGAPESASRERRRQQECLHSIAQVEKAEMSSPMRLPLEANILFPAHFGDVTEMVA